VPQGTGWIALRGATCGQIACRQVAEQLAHVFLPAQHVTASKKHLSGGQQFHCMLPPVRFTRSDLRESLLCLILPIRFSR